MIEIGQFAIMGDWDTHPEPDGKHIIRVEPSSAWGIGSHISTRLLLEELPHIISAGTSFLDIGCGAGIPMIAAAKLGAKVSGYEMDRYAAGVASRNAYASEAACDVTNIRWTCGVKHATTFDVVLINTGMDDLIMDVLDCPGLAQKVIAITKGQLIHNAWDVATLTGELKVFTRIAP